jgi:hypothetical protein
MKDVMSMREGLEIGPGIAADEYDQLLAKDKSDPLGPPESEKKKAVDEWSPSGAQVTGQPTFDERLAAILEANRARLAR